MAGVIRFAFRNFTLTLFLVGLIASFIALARAPRPLSSAAIIEAMFSYFFAVFDRRKLFLQFRHSYVFWCNSRAIHRVGR